MNGEKFWNSSEFKKFVLCFTLWLVLGPMFIGVRMAVDERVAKQQAKSQPTFVCSGWSIPFMRYITCRYK